MTESRRSAGLSRKKNLDHFRNRFLYDAREVSEPSVLLFPARMVIFRNRYFLNVVHFASLLQPARQTRVGFLVSSKVTRLKLTGIENKQLVSFLGTPTDGSVFNTQTCYSEMEILYNSSSFRNRCCKLIRLQTIVHI